MAQVLREGGFTDIHCHGGGGYYFTDSNPAHIQCAIDTHRKHGTSNLVASLVTTDIQELRAQITRLLPFVNSGELAGVHLEGPYLSHRRCGAHEPSLLRQPTVSEVKELIDLGQGAIVMFTIAPELPGALDCIRFMAENHVIAAIGHSDGNFDDAKAGIDAGATVVTHFSNAMSKLRDGDHTFATAVINDPRVLLEIIVDGHHVPLAEVAHIFEKAPLRIVLVTDAMSAAGGHDGDYQIGNLPVSVVDGVARLTSNGSLAGSTLTMDRAVELTKSAGVSDDAVYHASSVAPLDLLRRL